LHLEPRRVPGFLLDSPDLGAAFVLQPVVAFGVVALLPGRAVGLVGVELDDQVVVGPVAVRRQVNRCGR